MQPPLKSLRTSRIIPHLLAIVALLATALSAVKLAATPSWPTAFADQPAAPGCSGQPRFDFGVLRSAAPRFAHVVSAIPLRDGRVRAFWYEGARELGPDVAIRTSVYDAKTWTEPRTIMDAAATEKSVGVYVRKMGNPVVYRDAGGDLVMIFASVALGGWSGASLNMIRSADDGDVWSAPQRLVTTPTFNLSTLVKGPPVPLEGGFWLVPSYQGLVQRISEALLVDPAGRVIGRRRIGIGANQPQLAVTGRSQARVLMRAGETEPIRVSDTSDAGWSWSAMASIGLDSLDGPVAVASLGKGDLLMARSARSKIIHLATGMTLSVSQDGGTHWRALFHVDEALKIDGSMRYPWLTQAGDGLYHLFFTLVRGQGSELIHVQFNRDWIAARGGAAMSLTLVAWVGPMLIAAAAGSAVAAVFRLRTPFRFVLAMLFALAAVIPFGVRAFAPFLLSLTGPLSAATLLLLAELIAVGLFSREKSFSPSVVFLTGVLACGVLLYPATLDWMFDPYDLGYRGYAVPSLMAMLAGIGWIARSRDLPGWIILAALLHAGNVYGTGNLWNYLIDPVAVLIAGLGLIAILVRRWLARPARDAESEDRPAAVAAR